MKILRHLIRLLTLFALLPLCPLAAPAQIPSGFVQTTWTVAGVAGWSFSTSWTNLSSSPQLPLLGGVSTFPTTTTGQVSLAGTGTTLLADTSQIIPLPSTWTFQFTCPSGFTGGFKIQVAVVGGGGTQDISTQVAAAVPGTSCIPTGGGGGGIGPSPPSFSVQLANSGAAGFTSDALVTVNKATHTLVAPNVTASVNNQISVTSPSFGAQGNLTQFSGCSIAASSPTLTCSPGGFTQAMVGEQIVLWGAGTNNGVLGNPNYGPIITSVQTVASATQLNIATTATTAIPNATSNSAGRVEIGFDDTTAIQAAYCFAQANKLPLYFPPNLTGTSYWTRGLDLSCGRTSSFMPPISGNSKYVSTLTGIPGEPVMYWPDGFLGSGSNTLASVTNLNGQVDASIDTSCAGTVGATCATMADGQPAINRVSGYLIPAKGTGLTYTSTGSSVTVTATGTPWASTTINGGYSSGGIVNFQGCTSALAALNWTGSNSYPVTAGTSNTVTFTTALIAAGSGSDSGCSMYGGQPAPISVGQSGNVNGGTLTLDGSNYDFVNVGASIVSAGQWEYINQPFQINHITSGLAIYTGTITAINSNTQFTVSGGGCSACFATGTTYVATGTQVTVQMSNSYSAGDQVKVAATGGDALAALNGVTVAITSATGSQIVFNSAAISAGSGSTAATTLFTNFPYFFGSTSIQTPPWYVGTSFIAFPASAAVGGNVPRLFENLNISQIGGGANNTSHTAGFFFQEPPYATTFRHIFVNQTQYCYVETPYTTLNAVTWTPDTMQTDNFNCTTRVGPIFYAGNIRNPRSISAYTGATYFTFGGVNFNGPLNHAGGSTFESLYHEPGTGNFGEDLTIYGSGYNFVGPSWHQGLAGYVNFRASTSLISGGSIGEFFNETTAALRIPGTGNIFTSIAAGTTASNGAFSGAVQDSGGGNIVIGNDTIGPAYYNLPKCIPGQSDFGFLNVNAGTPYSSQCSLVWDYTTLVASGVVANIPPGSSYVQSTPGDGNPTAGYLFFPSSIVVGANLANRAFPMMVGQIVPVGTMDVVVGGYVGTPGNMTVQIKDTTLNTVIQTCVYSMTATFANHGNLTSGDPCTLTTTSGQTGHTLGLTLVTTPAVLGGLNFAYGALVPHAAPISATVQNLQAPSWTQWLGDGSDGALSVSSGSSAVVNNGEKWYSSLSISAGANLYFSSFSSPMIIRVTGGCNIAGTLSVSVNTGSAPGNPSSTQMGSSGGGGGGGTLAGTAGSNSVPNATAGTAGASSGGTGGPGATVTSPQYRPLIGAYTPLLALSTTVAGGAAGGAGGSAGGAGGKGGGAIALICGSLTFTGTIDASGGAGGASTGNNVGAGGGGGGGIIIMRSNNIITNTGTLNVTGGAGGSCGAFTGCGAGGAGGTGWSYVIPN